MLRYYRKPDMDGRALAPVTRTELHLCCDHNLLKLVTDWLWDQSRYKAKSSVLWTVLTTRPGRRQWETGVDTFEQSYFKLKTNGPSSANDILS